MKVSSRTYYVYIVSNSTRSTLYIGVTNNLERRIEEHSSIDQEHTSTSADPNSLASKKNPSRKKTFTHKYNCNILVYYESYSSIKEAINREKELKKWRSEWKDKLISEFNPSWQNLNYEMFEIPINKYIKK